jgi:hypothetical protein
MRAFSRALGLSAGAIAAMACARAAPVTTSAPAPATRQPAPTIAVDSSSSESKGVRTLPTTPSGLEQFVAAVPAPADTVGTCGSVPGSAFGEPTLRGITWTVAPPGGPERHVLLLVDSTGNPRHYSDLRGSDPRTEIAVNLVQGIGTATNFAGGKTTARVIAPASAVLAATSLGNGTRVARRVLQQCGAATR